MKKKGIMAMAIAASMFMVTTAMAKQETGVDIGSGCIIDCTLNGQGASGYAMTTAYVNNSNYLASAYIEACQGSSSVIKADYRVASDSRLNSTYAEVNQAWNATEYHSTHSCTGPASTNRMMIRV